MVQKNRYQPIWANKKSLRHLKAVLAFLIILFAVNLSKAQVLNGLQNKFARYHGNILREKIYTHTNKNYYLTGEILWFKLYCVDDSSNISTGISKVAYVELLDNNHIAVMQAKIGLKDGAGNGSLFIPLSLPNGNYLLRAYTSWMKNFGPGVFFEKQLTIANPLISPAIAAAVAAPVYDIRFMPEGGHLVNRLASKVAIKITGPDGKGVNCAGAIINKQNDTVARFKTLKFGIGSFVFTPKVDNAYKAIIYLNGQAVVKDLPEISATGYVMRVNPADDGWDVHVQSSVGTSAIFLLAHSKHAVRSAQEASLADGKATFHISKSKLDDGSTYLTLFNGQQRPVCERLVFKRSSKKLLVTVQPDNKAYGTRRKVSFDVSTQDQDSKATASNLSVTVYRDDELQNADAGDISSYLWLSAGFKGHVESAGYYLENNGKDADEALDNLLLAQGWAQFDWDRILAGGPATFTYLPEYTGHIITGQVVSTINKASGRNITGYLSVPGIRQQLYPSISDSTGRLLFNTRDFYGSGEIIVQTNSQTDSTYRIDIKSPFSDKYSPTTIPSFALLPAMENALTEGSINMQVQNIFKGNDLKEFYAKQIDVGPFYGTPGKTYKLDDYTRFATIEEVLREYVTSISVSKRQNKFNVRISNAHRPLGFKPLIMLDGVPIFDQDKIFHQDPLTIQKLEIVTTDFMYGPTVFNGIMSFATYNGDLKGLELDPHAVILDYEALQLERKFYSPVYNPGQLQNSPLPDFRSALYWNPDVNTGVDGKCSATFYSGDKPGRYIGVIEGISANGETGTGYFSFEVKK
ncbi:hypothetical protein [Mucilaginibacter sp.]|uniref:hypothetical protein n=1 Tax=Mucilaginibacter sp. TaxID=1882438 RepID=UPI0025DB0475|nr:hypothetical protein [Mucilaginibacter sp.]